MLKEIREIFNSAVKKLYPDVESFDLDIQEPSVPIDEDVSVNIASLAKKLKTSPDKIVPSLTKEVGIEGKGIIKSVSVKGAYLNCAVEEPFIIETIRKNIDFSKMQLPDVLQKKRVMIEFVSANPTGPLHIGHGRGAALGDSLARIYKQLGYAVQTEYYVNDVGVQMQILADSVKARVEEGTSFPENGYKGEYIKEIAREMKENGRSDFNQYPRTYILDWIAKDLEDFGVHFDNWFSESSLYENKKVEDVLKFLESKNCLKEKDGALWFLGQGGDSEKEPDDKERVLKKSDGRYTYFASDIAYHKNKFERGFDHCIDIWGHDHHGYVPRVESAVATLGLPKDLLKILLYQLVSLKRGGKKIAMSTRAGEFITLKEVLDEVGRDACRFFFAMRSPNSQLEFDVDLAKKQSNENPVYYVQYVHARICSIFSEAEKRGILLNEDNAQVIFIEKEERDLAKKLTFFEDTLETCLKISSPHLITTYLIDCAAKFHKFYDKCRVLDAEPKLRDSRFKLLQDTKKIVASGLSLLGVSAPEKM